MSKDGRITLVKSTPSSLPIYLMSILSMPTGVANKIEKQRTDFFGGGLCHAPNPNRSKALEKRTIKRTCHFELIVFHRGPRL